MRNDGIISASAMDAIALQLRKDTLNETVWDFAKGTGKPCGASHISAAYECRLESGEREAIRATLAKAGVDSAKINRLNDEQLSRVNEGIKKYGLSGSQASKASDVVDTLEATKAGGRKKGGDNLQDPGAAAKYAKFYENRGDETFKVKGNTSDKEVDFVIDSLKAEGAWSGRNGVSSALKGKGSPEESMEVQAWGKKDSEERGRAVLKSLMDNDFKDVNGDTLPWRSGMQLDHKLAGSMGGKDTPDNWIWVSGPTNQVKGSIENDVKRKGLKGRVAEDFVRATLITRLKENAAMSTEDVAKKKGAGSAAAAAKLLRRQALQENLPLMTREQKLGLLDGAKTPEVKDLIRSSSRSGGSAWVKKTARGQGSDPGVGAMKALFKMRWDLGNDANDLKLIGQAIGSAKFDKRPKAEILDDVIRRFGPTTGLTAAERIAILSAAE